MDIYQESIETNNYQKTLEWKEMVTFGLDTIIKMLKKLLRLYYEISKKHSLDLAQMSLKFLEIQPFVTSVIIGATTMEQLKTNIESVNIDLSEDVIKEINDVQKIFPNPCP